MNELSKRAQELRREYQRQWKKKNANKVKQYQANYWEKKAGNDISLDPVTAPVTVTDPVHVIGNTCLTCGKSFIGKRADSKYCSTACKQKHHREIKRNKVG